MNDSQKQQTCADRVQEHYNSTMNDLRLLWAAYCGEELTEEQAEEYENSFGATPSENGLYEYGLSFGYIAPNTFTDQEQGYFRYQLSWGGPSDEFRFYTNPDFSPYHIEYWFLDWFDGAHIETRGEDRAFLNELFDWFKESGTVQHEYERATEE
jgi:hypothetical protein